MEHVKDEFDAAVEAASNIKSVSIVFCIVDRNAGVRLPGSKDGTIASDGIKEEGLAQFFLAANGESEETVKYTLIQRTPNVWKDEHFAKLTYYLTFCFSGSGVRCCVPSPLFYASKLVEFCKKELNGDKPNAEMNVYAHYL